MQGIGWYWRRLRTMSSAEVLWRVRGSSRQHLDRCLVSFRAKPVSRARALGGDRAFLAACDATVAPQEGWAPPSEARGCPALAKLVERADRLLADGLRFFDVTLKEGAGPLRWNHEYSVGRDTPMGFAPAIDYRSFRDTGDAKVVWEPNRHQHLVVLARAYRATGDVRYAQKVVEQIDSWITQCPFGRGMNWRSPLELAVRIINWAWALDLIRDAGVVESAFENRLMSAVYRHLWEIDRSYSKFSSANNHLIGEASGALIASTFFSGLKDAAKWRDRASAILDEEVHRQTLDDGGNCELSPSYHLFVLEFFLLAGLTARRSGADFDKAYWDRLESMFDFTASMLEGGASCPSFCDSDDGYVLDLDAGEDRARSMMGVAGAMFDRQDFAAIADGCSERAFWLMGRDAAAGVASAGDKHQAEPLRSKAFADSGYYLLQCGTPGGGDRVSVAFDCGPLGFGAIAAHGHADALSFTLRLGGTDVLVDPGTFDYFTDNAWRNYFRSTRAHNTVEVDGQDQSEMTGPFMWGRRAQARCLAWSACDDGGSVQGTHDGYTRLSDPVTHTRTVALAGDDRKLLVEDELDASGDHVATIHFHFAEGCVVEDLGENRFGVSFDAGRMELKLDARLDARLRRGETDPISGWVSQGYHRKSPATTLVGSCSWRGRIRMATEMQFTPGPHPGVTQRGGRGEEAHFGLGHNPVRG